MEGEPFELPARLATHLALVANELITNAAKYCGSSLGDACVMNIGVRVGLGLQEGRLVLSVWNSGNPVPEDFDLTHAARTGLRLVDAIIVDQYPRHVLPAASGGGYAGRSDRARGVPAVARKARGARPPLTVTHFWPAA